MGSICKRAGISGRKDGISGGKCPLFEGMLVCLEGNLFLEETAIGRIEKWSFWSKMSSLLGEGWYFRAKIVHFWREMWSLELQCGISGRKGNLRERKVVLCGESLLCLAANVTWNS